MSLMLFDADDTLWETNSHYEKAKRDFGKGISKMIPISVEDAIKRLDEIDLANIETLRFSKERFSVSMIDTYEELCGKWGIASSVTTKLHLYDIGQRPLYMTPSVYPYVKDTLELLKDDGHTLVMYTLGAREAQEGKIKKIEKTGIANLFDGIEVVATKDIDTLYETLVRYNANLKDTFMVGNSWRSDITPALALGLKCIWIEHEGAGKWDYNSVGFEAGNYKVRRINSFQYMYGLITDYVFKNMGEIYLRED